MRFRPFDEAHQMVCRPGGRGRGAGRGRAADAGARASEPSASSASLVVYKTALVGHCDSIPFVDTSHSPIRSLTVHLRRSEMKSNLLPMVLALQVLVVYQTSWLPPAHAADVSKGKASQVLLCMMNCGQCKEMYGEYFDGRRCAEFCLTGGGSRLPDCNVPDTVDRFFKTSDSGQLPLIKEAATGVEPPTDMWKRFMGIKRRYLSRSSYL